jgi:hypothetical protein
LDKEGEFVEDREMFAPEARLKATVDADKNRISIEASSVRSLRVYLSDGLLNMDKDIEVIINRRTLFNKKVERSLEFMLQEVSKTGERDRHYWGQVTIQVK